MSCYDSTTSMFDNDGFKCEIWKNYDLNDDIQAGGLHLQPVA